MNSWPELGVYTLHTLTRGKWDSLSFLVTMWIREACYSRLQRDESASVLLVSIWGKDSIGDKSPWIVGTGEVFLRQRQNPQISWGGVKDSGMVKTHIQCLRSRKKQYCFQKEEAKFESEAKQARHTRYCGQHDKTEQVSKQQDTFCEH